MFKKRVLGIILSAAVLFGGCAAAENGDTSGSANRSSSAVSSSAVESTDASGEISDASSAAGQDASYPVTIKNYTAPEGVATWTEKEHTYGSAPERILVNTRPAAELLLHLGLKDRIAGVSAVFGAADEAVSADFDTLNEMSTSYIGKEVALSVDPDMVISRGGLFDNADWGVGTVDSLNDMGIATYALGTSVTGGTFDTVYEDIENLGKIFAVSDQADAFTASLKERQQAVEEKLTVIETDQTFAYLHMSDPEEVSIYSAYGETFFASIFKMVRLENVFADVQGDVSLEALIEADPDVIIVPEWESYDGSENTVQTVIDSLLTNPKLTGMKAMQNKAIYSMDYNHMFGYGYQSLDGVEKLAQTMYPELFA